MLNAIQKAAVRHCVAYDLSPPESRLSHTDWCAQVGISRRTLERWQEMPEFASAVQSSRDSLEESSDPYALIARTIALETLMNLLDEKKMTIAERRAVIKDIMSYTSHVDDSGVPVNYDELTDEDLVNTLLDRKLTPLGMTEAQLRRLGESACQTSPSSSSLPVPVEPPDTSADTSPAPAKKPRVKKSNTSTKRP